MLKRVLGVLVLGACIVPPGIAAAQERAPHAGSTAVGIDAGVFVPKESEFDNALIINALLEYYLTPRFSLRTNFGLTDPGFSQESSDSLRQIPFRVDANYNWEGGKWHPFVGAGVGAYFMQVRDNGKAFGESDTSRGSTSAAAWSTSPAGRCPSRVKAAITSSARSAPDRIPQGSSLLAA